jgi:hypothetical protein
MKTPFNKKTIPGINIQWPWSEYIANGTKVIETRGYPIPIKHLNVPIALIETPGKKGKSEAGISKSRIIAVITFSSCYKYENMDQWKEEKHLHLVDLNDSPFAFNETKAKWAWVISSVKTIKPFKPAPKTRGIVFAKECVV